MNIKQLGVRKKYCLSLLIVAVIVLIFHCICGIVVASAEHKALGVESWLLNVIAYGIPVAAFLTGLFVCEKERWNRADTVFLTLEGAVYAAMVIHVTIEGFLFPDPGYIYTFFNVPIFYAIPSSAIGLVWLIYHARPHAGMKKAGKVLYILPIVAFGAMLIHCGIEMIKYMTFDGVHTAPWWSGILLYMLPYVPVILILLGAYAIYRLVQNHKKKKA